MPVYSLDGTTPVAGGTGYSTYVLYFQSWGWVIGGTPGNTSDGNPAWQLVEGATISGTYAPVGSSYTTYNPPTGTLGTIQVSGL